MVLAVPPPVVEALSPIAPASLRRVLIDSPSDNPGLGFPTYVDALSRVITESKPHFAVGVYGSWGSGKTTLMNAIRQRLDKDPSVICASFVAWRYEKESHLIVPLIDTIREALITWSSKQSEKRFASAGLKTAEKLGLITKALAAGMSFKLGLPHAAEISFEANKAIAVVDERHRLAEAAKVPRSFYFASFRALEKAFKEFGAGEAKRFVVFIDDLDRCLPKGTLDILESMKLFFDIDGFIFVVGVDREVVEWCIEASYLREFPVMGSPDSQTVATRGADYIKIKGSEYINKIVQVPFTLPPISLRELDDFVAAITRENQFTTAEDNELRQVVRPHLNFLAGDAGINPRRVKKYRNDYILQRSVKPLLHPAAVLALLTINYRNDWGVVRSAFYADDRQLVVAALRYPDVASQRQALEDVDPNYVAVPNEFLRYVAAATVDQPPGPGRDLLLVSNLDDYIYAGETTMADANSQLIEVLPRVSRLRRMLNESIGADGAVGEAKDLIQELSELISKVPFAVPGASGAWPPATCNPSSTHYRRSPPNES